MKLLNILKECPICYLNFHPYSRDRGKTTTFCSIKCKNKNQLGISPANKGIFGVYKASEETKIKMSINNGKYWLGKKHSQETKLKISNKLKLIKPQYNKGKKLSEETKLKISNTLKRKGIKPTVHTSTLPTNPLLGKPRIKARGSRNPNWKGGVTPINAAIRTSLEYKNWRRKVFERDNYTCTNCKIRGGNLEADHIKPFALYAELRFEISNGRTFCRPCHKKIGWRGKCKRELRHDSELIEGYLPKPSVDKIVPDPY